MTGGGQALPPDPLPAPPARSRAGAGPAEPALGEQVVVRGVRNARRDRVLSRLFWGVLLGVPSGVLLLSALWPDALDRLPARERAVAGFLDDAGVCGLPFGRVVEVRTFDRDDPHSIRYRCGWTVFRLGSSTSEAYCADGQWRYPGLMDMQSGGPC